MEKAYEKIIKILELNNSADELYRRLAKLEIDHKINSSEYNDYIGLLKWIKDKEVSILSTIDLSSEEVSNVMSLIVDLNHLSEEDLDDYTVGDDNIKLKRFIEHSSEQLLKVHNFPKLEYNYNIFGEDYESNDAIELLEELGNEETAKQIKEEVNEINQEINYSIILDDNLERYKFSLEFHTFLQYLENQIKYTKDIKLKERLIKMKYRFIGIVNCLENAFLSNPKYHDRTILYRYAILNNLEGNEEKLKESYLDYYEEIIDYELNNIIVRNKNEYNNQDEIVNDIIVMLKLKSMLSIIYDKDMFNKLKDDRNVAIDMANTELDKDLIKKSFVLNKNLTILK